MAAVCREFFCVWWSHFCILEVSELSPQAVKFTVPGARRKVGFGWSVRPSFGWVSFRSEKLSIADTRAKWRRYTVGKVHWDEEGDYVIRMNVPTCTWLLLVDVVVVVLVFFSRRYHSYAAPPTTLVHPLHLDTVNRKY